MSSPTIASAAIVPDPSGAPYGLEEPQQVRVTYEDGAEQVLFTYYSDELTFAAEEFRGLTRSDALGLFKERDLAWLRS